MLTADYGYRPPSPLELARIGLRAGRKRRRGDWAPAHGPFIQASLLSTDPLISYSGLSLPLGVAGLLPRLPRHHRGWFLLSPTWSIEHEGPARQFRTRAVLHRLRQPGHSLIALCNTPGEVETLRRHGEAAFFHNKTSSASEEIFRPLDGVNVEFDAVYNAQLAPFKRHELSLGVERCAFLFYRAGVGLSTRESEQELIARHARLAPGHVFVNRLDAEGTPIRLTPAEVNVQLNRAAVGLCLSEAEGPMFACTEYLLAGLPIVTTPSLGGRDVYLDEEFCLTVPPDARAVAEAVAALKARRIPRAHIRNRTLARLEKDRSRFIDLVNAIFAEAGADTRITTPWPFRRPVIMEWMPPAVARERAMNGIVDAFAN
jgi:glycosyltransferase involved in cell wall biosynthesis